MVSRHSGQKRLPDPHPDQPAAVISTQHLEAEGPRTFLPHSPLLPHSPPCPVPHTLPSFGFQGLSSPANFSLQSVSELGNCSCPSWAGPTNSGCCSVAKTFISTTGIAQHNLAKHMEPVSVRGGIVGDRV